MYAYASVPCLLHLPFYHWDVTIDIVTSNGESTRPRARTKSRQPPLAGGTASAGGATQSRRSPPGSPGQQQCQRARAAAEARPSQGLVARRPEWCRAMIWVVPLSGQLHRASAPRAAQRSAAGTPPSRRSQDVCSLKRSSRACAACTVATTPRAGQSKPCRQRRAPASEDSLAGRPNGAVVRMAGRSSEDAALAVRRRQHTRAGSRGENAAQSSL